MEAQSNIRHPHLYMTMSLQYLSHQLDQLETFGFLRSEALTALNLGEADFAHPKARTDAARVEHMYKIAAAALSDPLIAIRIGYKFRVHDYQKTGSIYSYCNNMVQVIELMSRYQCLAVDVGIPEYRIENDRHFFVYNRYEDAKDMHYVMGLILGAWATGLRWLGWSSGCELKEAHLMPKAPDDISFYQEIVQCPIVFNMPRNHVEFHSESITKPLLTRDPEKLAHCIATLDKLLQKGNSEKNFETSVKASIQAAMSEGSVSLSVVAARMNIAERQFRNKMTNLELSFRDMLETERKQLFQKLHNKDESFATIAHALAYNDQAAFNRAFKRWYDTTPSQYSARQSKHI